MAKEFDKLCKQLGPTNQPIFDNFGALVKRAEKLRKEVQNLVHKGFKPSYVPPSYKNCGLN